MSTWRSSGGRGDGLPRRLGESLNRVARALGGGDSSVMTVVFRNWEAAVGPAIAEHAQPLSLRNAVLVVGVTEPAWATQLRFLTPEILARLEEAAGRSVAERIEVRIRPFRAP
jgi:predicted nucleic acid-binding Zn ribbon protein